MLPAPCVRLLLWSRVVVAQVSYVDLSYHSLAYVDTLSGVAVDSDVLKLSLTITTQSVVKHFLTEGDKLLLSYFSPLQDQGGYALAVNYGISEP